MSLKTNSKSIVIYNKDWHKGIIGIVASRLTEVYYKPSVVLTLANGLATGSSRSVQGFDVYKAVESTRDILENFGGHTYAVGLSMKEENIPEFSRRFEEYVAANILPTQLTPQLDIDAVLVFADITTEFVSSLNLFNPASAPATKSRCSAPKMSPTSAQASLWATIQSILSSRL